jgi:hypothetical protein
LPGIWGSALQAAEAPERKRVSEQEVSKHCPANMFEMVENKEPAVCDPLLASVNEAKVITNQRVQPIIQNKFVINPWRKQKYYWTRLPNETPKTRSWEVGYLDLDGDGVKDGLFRIEVSGPKFNISHGFGFIRSADSNIVLKDSLSELEANKIYYRLVGVHVKESYGKRKFPPSYVEIIRINKKNYLLLFSAYYWSRKTKSRFPFVCVLKRDSTQYHQICHFKGVIEVVRGS